MVHCQSSWVGDTAGRQAGVPLGFSGDLSPVRRWPASTPTRPLPTMPLSFLSVWVTVRSTQVHWPRQWLNHEWAVSLITVAACVRLQNRHKQTCRSPFGIHHAHPVHTQACLSQLSPLIATPPPGQERLSLSGPGGNSQGQMGCCPEPHAGRACTDTFSVRAGNHLPEPSWDGLMGLCWEGQHCPNWGPQLQGSEWGAPS